MAIAYGSAAGASAWVGNSFSHGLPSATAVGDMLVLVVSIKSTTNTLPNAPTGWDKIGSASGGVGTFGVDTGPCGIAVYTKVATTAGAQSVTIPSVPSGGGGSADGAVLSMNFTKSAGETWATPTGSVGVDTTSGTSWSITGDASMSVVAGDVVFEADILPSDAMTISSKTISIPGATLGANTGGSSTPITAGNDNYTRTSYSAVTGAGSGVPTVTGTLNTASGGPAVMVRLSVAAASSQYPVTGQTDAVSGTAGDVTSLLVATGSPAAAVSSTGTLATAARRAVTGATPAVTGSALAVAARLKVTGSTAAVSACSLAVASLLVATMSPTAAASSTTGTVTSRLAVTGSAAATSGTSLDVGVISGPQQYATPVKRPALYVSTGQPNAVRLNRQPVLKES